MYIYPDMGFYGSLDIYIYRVWKPKLSRYTYILTRGSMVLQIFIIYIGVEAQIIKTYIYPDKGFYVSTYISILGVEACFIRMCIYPDQGLYNCPCSFAFVEGNLLCFFLFFHQVAYFVDYPPAKFYLLVTFGRTFLS